MKKLTQMRFIIVALVFATILIGCKKQQSSVSIEDFTEKAIISGTLQYDEGQGFDGTKYTRIIKPAANITLTAFVANSEYSTTTSAEGDITFTTTTDAEGNFEIEIPVTNEGVDVTLKANSFKGQYNRIIDVKNGAPVYSNENGIYKFNERSFFLKPNDIKIANDIFTFEVAEDIIEFPYHSKYQVVINKASYTKDFIENEIRKQYVPANNVEVIINVNDGEKTYKYTASTNVDGIATFNIPTKTLTWSPDIEITTKQFTTNNFIYYRKYNGEITQHILSGYYRANSYTDHPQFNDINGMPTTQCEDIIKMKFYTFDGTEDYGHNNEYWGY